MATTLKKLEDLVYYGIQEMGREADRRLKKLSPRIFGTSGNGEPRDYSSQPST